MEDGDKKREKEIEKHRQSETQEAAVAKDEELDGRTSGRTGQRALNLRAGSHSGSVPQSCISSEKQS